MCACTMSVNSWAECEMLLSYVVCGHWKSDLCVPVHC